MHTYRKAESGGWQAGYQYPEEPRFNPLGPIFDLENEAAAYVSFLNGGRYNPYEIEPVFLIATVEDDEDDDSTHPDRPDFDYELERKRKRG